ncbi:hypothetical protein [Oleiharenicola lentus]|uniref:hypothetical protein n=1 Tax=Oleiharenicola lentus TaxID=2508720 RepID=UPI003F66C92E
MSAISAYLDPLALPIYQGRDQSFALEISRSDIEADAGQIDGIAFCMKQHGAMPDADAVIRKKLGAGITLLADSDPEKVFFCVDLTAAETAALSVLIAYPWDVSILDSEGKLRPVDGLAGKTVVLPRVGYTAG